jgi:hypothetical protein
MKNFVRRGLIVAVFALSMLACNLATAATPLPATDLSNQALPTDLPSQALETDTPASVVLSTPASNQVTVTVIKESLYIRRGPSTEYDVLGTFLAGQSAVASFRDANSDWVVIPLPSRPSVYGWVSIKTQFTSVEGEVSSLEVKKVDPAIPARIRNCTFHPMLIQPGNVLIKPKGDAPSNAHDFPPGNYAAYDQNQEGHPQVASFSLAEGNKVDINLDGLGNTYYCP